MIKRDFRWEKEIKRITEIVDKISYHIYTVCAGSSDPFYIASLLYKLGRYFLDILYLYSVPKFTTNLYCICLSINLRYTKADAVQIRSKFWDTI